MIPCPHKSKNVSLLNTGYRSSNARIQVLWLKAVAHASETREMKILSLL